MSPAAADWNSPYSPVCALGTSPKGEARARAVSCLPLRGRWQRRVLPPPPGALGVPQCAHWGGGGTADGRGSPAPHNTQKQPSRKSGRLFFDVKLSLSLSLRASGPALFTLSGRRGRRPLRHVRTFPRRGDLRSPAVPPVPVGTTIGRPSLEQAPDQRPSNARPYGLGNPHLPSP